MTACSQPWTLLFIFFIPFTLVGLRAVRQVPKRTKSHRVYRHPSLITAPQLVQCLQGNALRGKSVDEVEKLLMDRLVKYIG